MPAGQNYGENYSYVIWKISTILGLSLQDLYVLNAVLGTSRRKQEIHKRIRDCDLIGIAETSLESLRAQSAAMSGYKLSVNYRSGQQGRGVTLQGRKQWEYMEHCLGADDNPVESLFVRIREQSNTCYLVSICNKLPHQGSL